MKYSPLLAQADNTNSTKRLPFMNRLPDQSFDYDLELMKLAAELSELSARENLDEKQIHVPLRHRRILTTSLVDTSVLSWVAKGSPDNKGALRLERDLKAFGDLTLLAGIGRIKLHIPASVVDELEQGRFSSEAKSKISNTIRLGRMKIKAAATRFAIGQKPYGIEHESIAAALSPYDDDLRELLAASPDPAVPKEDQEHYLLACISGFSFVSMDYKLVERMSGAIKKQIAVVKGENRQKTLPKSRPALRVPVITTSLLLQQIMYHQPEWKAQLALARTEPDCRICDDLRRQFLFVGQELATTLIDPEADSHHVCTLKGQFQAMEQQLQQNRCNSAFFDGFEVEWRPDYWKSIKAAPLQISEDYP